MLRARLFFGISVFLLLGASFALILTLRQLDRSAGLVAHCYREINAADTMVAKLSESETRRSGLPTRRAHILAPFLATIPQIHQEMTELRSLAASVAEERDRPQMLALASARLSEIRATLNQAQAARRTAAGMATTTGNGTTMERLRGAVDRFDRDEQGLMDKRMRSVEAAERRALIIAYTTVLAVACTALLAAFLFLRRGRHTERVLAGALEDIAEGRSALTAREQQLAAALEREKTVVRELHHRVKNNLQVMTSLLQLRARARQGAMREELEDLAGRMRALALVQAHIYHTDSFDRVDLAATLSEIAEHVVAGYGGEEVELVRDLDGPLDLNVSRAVPLGLVCYEIMLNAMKHAWPDERRGILRVITRAKTFPQTIEIADNGVGYVPAEIHRGLGTLLLRSLPKEAAAEVEIESRPGVGTTVILRLC